MTITDLYRILFGREGTSKGSDIDMSEHGRQGGIAAKHGLKYIENIAITMRVDVADSTTTYIGKAAPGTAEADELWQIMKVDSSSGTSIKYPSGSDNYSYAWSSRAGYTYS